jgi:hypothetical protein
MKLPPFRPVPPGNRREVSNHPAIHYLSASSGTILPASLPPECARVPSYSKAECWGVVQVCQDCCQLPDPRSPANYNEHCGSKYPCGVCFGLPF